jgi:hypothetical protein
MTRVLRLAVLLGAFVAAAAAAGCGASVTSGEPVTFEQLASSAKTSAEATSGRFAFSMEMTMPDAPEQFAFSGEGAFDAAARRASLSFDLSSLAGLLGALLAGFGGGADAPDFGDPSQWQLESIQDGDIMYMRLPAVSGELPDGKTWVRMDLRKDGESKGFDFSELEQFTNNDPRKALDFLRAASGEIETVGSETLRGTETTHYRATVDLGDYERLVPASEREQAGSMFGDLVDESGVGEVPVDVWLDESGLVRKLTMAVTATEPGSSETTEVTVSFELWDYGEDLAIELPPADEVADESVVPG